MTSESPDVDRLADLDADIAAGHPVDPPAPSDPASRAVLDALAATRAELARLPPVPLPAELAARWTAALTTARAEGTGTPNRPVEHAGGGADPARDAPPNGRHDASAQPRHPGGRARTRVSWQPFPRTGSGSGPARPARRRRRRQRARPALAVGLALVALLVVAGVVRAQAALPSVTAAELGGVARAAVGSHDAGEFADPVRRAGCLRSVAPRGLGPDALLVGGRGVEYEGRPGVLLVLASGRLGTFRVVVVDPACGPGGGTLLADTLVGR